MATKLKKYYDELRQTPADSKNWRNIGFVGWLSFFLSISILLTIAGCYFGPRAAAAMGGSSYEDLMQDDYKNTSLFRNSVVSGIYSMAYVNADGSCFGDIDAPYSYHSYFSSDQNQAIFSCAAVEDDKLIFQHAGMNYNALLTENFRTQSFLLKITLQNFKVTDVKILQDGNILKPEASEWIFKLRNSLLGITIPDFTDENRKITSGVKSDKGRTFYFTITDSLPSTNVYSAYATEKQLYRGITENSALLALAVLLLAVSILFYPGKQKGDRAFASLVGHIPIEIKLLLLLVLYICPIMYSTGHLHIFTGLETLHFALVNCLFYLLWYVWLTYFVVNDIRYKTFAKHSIIRRLWQTAHGAVQQNNVKTPLAKQIQRWLLPLFVLVDICMVPCVLFFGLSDNIFATSSGYHHLLRLIFFGGLAAAVIYLEYRIWKKSKFLGTQMAKLTEQIRLIRSGAQPQPIHVGGCDQLSAAAYDLNAVQDGIEAAVNERVRSERMKVELVTNVSHDLKTPLTSIISYVDLLGQEELSPTARDYVQILAQKSDRLKAIVQDVFDISKAVSGNLAVNNKTLDLAKLLRQTLADMDEQISAAPLTFRVQLPEQPVWIYSDGDRLYRVFQNLIQNAVQYSLENSRVYITLAVLQGYAHAKVRNTSKHEIGDAQALLERFTRGDKNRTTEGSGLGLSIAQSFTQACSGTFSVSAQADLFIAEVVLPLGQAPQTNNSSGTVLEPVLADSPKNTNTPAS